MSTDIHHVMDSFLESLHIRGLSENTIDAYSSDLLHLVHFIEKHNLPWLTIDKKNITSFLVYLHKEKQPSKRSRARCISVLRSFYHYCVKEKILDYNPFKLTKAPKYSKTLPKVIPPNQMRMLLEENIYNDNDLIKKDLEIRDIALWELMYSSGMRVSEILGLNVESILDIGDDLVSKKIYDTIKITGKGKKDRTVFIGSEAKKALQNYLNIRTTLLPLTKIENHALFLNARGERLSRRGALYLLKNRLSQLELPTKYKVHSIRHAFATDLLNNGAEIRNIQEMLGHKSISTTQNYSHLATDKLQETFRKCHPHATKGEK